MKKLAVLLGSLALFVLLAEGTLSFWAGGSLRRLGRSRTLLERLDQQELGTDRDSFLAAARTPGPFRVAEDPLVCNTFKADTEVEFLGERFCTDALGLRERPGPPRTPGSFHLVFLGDSVAFGHGLSAEDGLAAQVEGLLREARASGGREIVCSTVAVPGWNYRNAVRHLLDHLDRIAPDLVLYMPVENDLDDSYGVTEAGQRRRLEDPGVPRPLCVVAPPLDILKTFARASLNRGGRELLERTDLDRWLIHAGLGGTARWRVEDMTATLALAHERLARVGARLVLLPYTQHDLHRVIRARLIERGLDLPVIPLLDRLQAADGQGKNPHPSAETTRAMALWTAQALVEQGLVPLEIAREWPALPARMAERRGRELGRDEVRAWRAEFERATAAALVPRIEPGALLGIPQIQGGVHPDGSLGIESAFLLPPGRRLRVELAAGASAPGLHPLELEVLAGEEPLGTLVLGQADAAAEFELPRAARDAPFEVRIRAGDWALARVAEHVLPVSARLVALASLGP